jgi:hypothetical protein
MPKTFRTRYLAARLVTASLVTACALSACGTTSHATASHKTESHKTTTTLDAQQADTAPTAHIPGNSHLHWKPKGTPTAITDPQQLHQDLWTPWGGGLTGFTSRQEQDFAGANQTTTTQATARQYIFTFPTANAAKAAYQRIADTRAACVKSWASDQIRHGTPADASVHQTATGPSASSWAWRWTGFTTPMTAAGPQIDHEYLLQHGSTLSITDIYEPLPTIGDASAVSPTDDAAFLQAMTTLA